MTKTRSLTVHRVGTARLLATSLLALALLAAAPSGAGAQPRALLAFLPTEPAPRMPLLFDVAERGMAYGVTSPTLGGFSKRQMVLDVSQGARVARGAYPERLPGRLDLVPSGRGARIEGWREAEERADDAPGDIRPGLFAEVVRASGREVAYSGIAGFEQVEAVAAADRAGRIGEVSLGTFGTFVERTLGLWERADLVVARFPRDDRGLEALDRILAERGPEDLVYVVRAPPAGGLKLLPTGIAGPGFERAISSDTTRQEGLVAATDLPVTVLEHLGVEVPDEMQGEPVESGGGASAGDVRDHMARLDIVLSRRGAVMSNLFLFCLILVGLLAFARREPGLRAALRVSFLAILWLPGVALVCSALAPSYTAEIYGSALGCILLGALTDRLVPWPGAPALPAAVVFVAHTVDLAFGSPLIGGSVLGPNPEGGARFYGIGNELESILSVTLLIGTGAALSLFRVRRPAHVFGAVCLVAAVVIGAGRLGADVGGVITLGAGAAGAVLASLPGGPNRRAIALAVAAPVAGLGALVAIDLLTGGGAHLTRTVLEAEDAGDVFEVVERRLGLSVKGLWNFARAVQVAAGIGLIVWALRNRERLLAPLRAYPAFVAGLAGVLSATVIGAVANDSGPLIFITGSAALALSLGYVASRPVGSGGEAGGGARQMGTGAADSRDLSPGAPSIRLR